MKITAQDLRVQLGGREILRGLDIAAEDGQFVGIIGPNGSGKSALLRCIGPDPHARRRGGVPGRPAGGGLASPGVGPEVGRGGLERRLQL